MNSRKIVFLALIAAVYTVLSIVLSFISFGNIQIRIAEALTLLPVIMPLSIYAITLGCFLTNLIGVFMGVNILGWLDVLIGTITTLVAGYLTFKLAKFTLKGYPILACLPPIILNGLVIGLELTLVLNGAFDFNFFCIMFIEVAIGQSIAIFIFGLPLIKKIKQSNILQKFRID